MYRRRLGWAFTVLTVAGYAQTQVDLRTQAKRIDFSAASSTRPLKTGVTLPASCAAGEMFFKSDAVPGENLYGCVATNTWALESGAGGGGSVTVSSSGTPVGTRPVINFVAGEGITTAISDTGEEITVQHGVDSAVVQTHQEQQAGSALLCVSSGTVGANYSCHMAPTLTTYSMGMVLHWRPDQSATGEAMTLNVDALGARPIKMADGVADPSPIDVVGSRMYTIWYDGSQFRLVTAVVPGGILADTRPACGSATRGRFWYAAGSPGVQDEVSVCAKGPDEAFAWRRLY